MEDVGRERKAFEEWFEVDAMPAEHSNWFRKDGDGDYEIDHVDHAWRGWEARSKRGPAGHTLIQEYLWNREDGTVIGDHINVDFHEDGLHITIKGFPFRYEVIGDMPDLNTGRKIVSTKERPLLIPYPATFEVSVSAEGAVSVFSRP